MNDFKIKWTTFKGTVKENLKISGVERYLWDIYLMFLSREIDTGHVISVCITWQWYYTAIDWRSFYFTVPWNGRWLWITKTVSWICLQIICKFVSNVGKMKHLVWKPVLCWDLLYSRWKLGNIESTEVENGGGRKGRWGVGWSEREWEEGGRNGKRK